MFVKFAFENKSSGKPRLARDRRTSSNLYGVSGVLGVTGHDAVAIKTNAIPGEVEWITKFVSAS